MCENQGVSLSVLNLPNVGNTGAKTLEQESISGLYNAGFMLAVSLKVRESEKEKKKRGLAPSGYSIKGTIFAGFFSALKNEHNPISWQSGGEVSLYDLFRDMCATRRFLETHEYTEEELISLLQRAIEEKDMEKAYLCWSYMPKFQEMFEDALIEWQEEVDGVRMCDIMGFQESCNQNERVWNGYDSYYESHDCNHFVYVLDALKKCTIVACESLEDLQLLYARGMCSPDGVIQGAYNAFLTRNVPVLEFLKEKFEDVQKRLVRCLCCAYRYTDGFDLLYDMGFEFDFVELFELASDRCNIDQIYWFWARLDDKPAVESKILSLVDSKKVSMQFLTEFSSEFSREFCNELFEQACYCDHLDVVKLFWRERIMDVDFVNQIATCNSRSVLHWMFENNFIQLGGLSSATEIENLTVDGLRYDSRVCDIYREFCVFPTSTEEDGWFS